MTENDAVPAPDGPYAPAWTSLRRHGTPDWLREAKLGIYCHWGLDSVRYADREPGMSEDAALERWRAEAFDPAAWAELFVRSGARFGGPVAWHGGPLLHWDSKIDPHNTVRKGPRRDVVGGVTAAVRAAGLKTLMSFHSIDDDGWTERASEAVAAYAPDAVWVDASFGGTKQAHHLEIVDHSRYVGGPRDASGKPNPGAHPEGVLESLAEPLQKRFLADAFNRAHAAGRALAFIYKSFDVPPGVGTRDLENGLLDHVAYDPWVTDIDLSLPPDWATHGWFYRPGVPLRTAANLVHVLLDVVSKNGTLLLNAPPLASGAFPQEVTSRLEALGAWLKVHGAAVYGASPWTVYGEGPATVETGNYAFHHNDHFGTLRFGPDDVRYTCNPPSGGGAGERIYASVLGPVSERVTLGALGTGFRLRPGAVRGVTWLGRADVPLTWPHGREGLVIDVPEGAGGGDGFANVFEVDAG